MIFDQGLRKLFMDLLVHNLYVTQHVVMAWDGDWDREGVQGGGGRGKEVTCIVGRPDMDGGASPASSPSLSHEDPATIAPWRVVLATGGNIEEMPTAKIQSFIPHQFRRN